MNFIVYTDSIEKHQFEGSVLEPVTTTPDDDRRGAVFPDITISLTCGIPT
jgi:hypothetical protein